MKADKKGRTKGAPHVRLDFELFFSPAYKGLSTTARALLFEMIALYNGRNNGTPEMYLGVRDAAKLIGATDTGTAQRALSELQDHGFVRVYAQGHFQVKERHATCWRLTFHPANGAAPTNEWRDWRPEPGAKAWKRLEGLADGCNLRSGKSIQAVLKIQTDVAILANDAEESVRKINTATAGNPRNAVAPSVRKINTQILCHTNGVSAANDRAPLSAYKRARRDAAAWVARQGYGASKQLAALSGLDPSRISRLLSDEHHRRSLTVDELNRLNRAMLAFPMAKVASR